MDRKQNKEKNLYPSECTTILVGKNQMQDGSMIVARSEDWDAMIAKNIEFYTDTEQGPERFVALDSPFRCDLPKKALGYTALAPFCLRKHWGSAGFNSLGIGMSATESIFSSDEILKYDPLIEDGVAENSVFNIVLPYIKSAREGAEYLGALIEKHGVAEGFGVGFVDTHEIWYLETASGHRWLACRIPQEEYFVTGNQSRFRKYDPKDTENYLASKDLIEFAIECKVYDPKVEEFDFHKAYIRDIELDTTYNYPRVWGIQQMLSPSIKNDVTKNTFPVYAKAEKLLTMSDIRKVFRFHYQDTEHDPYLNNNPKEVYRPVSIFRTTQTHILQVRPKLPQAIGCVNHICFGMGTLSMFMPMYQGIKSIPEEYTKGTDQSSQDSAYWKMRKVQTLGMVNYNKYAPIIQARYRAFEEETDQRQKEMEMEYLRIYKEQPLKAQELLQEFSDKMFREALRISDELVEILFTEITRDTQATYRFAGA